MIIFSNVSKIYDNGTKALDNISFFIERGEFVFIVGPSGSGKSTLIKLLMHEETATSGDVIINSVNVNALKQSQIPYLRRNMGVVFQDFRLLPKKTVYENVSFAMEIVGASRREIRRRHDRASARKEDPSGVMRQAPPPLFDKRRVALSAGYAALCLFL